MRSHLSRRTVLSGAAILSSTMGLNACGPQGARDFTSTDTHPKDYPTVQAVEEMGRLLRARSGGRLGIHIYAGGQLGSETDTLEITTFGGLDMNRVNLAPLNAIEPLTVIPSLPFLFKSTAHMRRALDGDIGQSILDALTPHGLIGLCFYDSGERSFYNSKHPIYTPSDLKGLKLRVVNSDLFVSMVRNLGADATPMPLSEVYSSLVQGVIDGAENNPPSYETGRHFEAAPYLSLTRHVVAPEVLVMSKVRWDKLTKADQALVRETARESVTYMRTLWDARVDGAMARLVKAGVKVNQIDDLEAFRIRVQPVWKQFIRTPQLQRMVHAIEALSESAPESKVAK